MLQKFEAFFLFFNKIKVTCAIIFQKGALSMEEENYITITKKIINYIFSNQE